jgi:3-hydroxyphenylacetate 6-hydroxylase
MILPTAFDLSGRDFWAQALQTFAITTVIVPLLYVIVNEYFRYAARIPGIKGPPGLPLVGNLWSIRKNAPEQYRVWSKKYGGVYQVLLGNVPIIIVNTAEAAKAIFGQHAQAMSSRPEFYTFHKVSPVHSNITEKRLTR